MEDVRDRSSSVSETTIREMVADLRPEWTVDSIDRHPHATDLVVTVDVETPERQRTVVFKATTWDRTKPVVARAEPRLLELVGNETSIPVPTVVAHRDHHDTYPAPFYLMEYVPGRNLGSGLADVPWGTLRQLCDRLATYLAELHEFDRLPYYGDLGGRDGEVRILDTGDFDRHTDFRSKLRSLSESYLAELDGGGPYAELADDPTRFADLVPDVRSYLEATIPTLPEPDPPAYCHDDYRFGNVLVDLDTASVNGVIDWADVTAADPVYNLAKAETFIYTSTAHLDHPTDALRRGFRSSYSEARSGWTIDDSVRERLRVYRLVCRVRAMMLFPLWYRRAPPALREEVATAHREFVGEYVE